LDYVACKVGELLSWNRGEKIAALLLTCGPIAAGHSNGDLQMLLKV
jgi:hypothetical protein